MKTSVAETKAGRKKLAGSGHALSDGSYPIPNVKYLKKAIKAKGRTKPSKWPALAALIRKEGKRLGATDVVKNSWAGGTKKVGLAGAIPIGSSTDGPQVTTGAYSKSPHATHPVYKSTLAKLRDKGMSPKACKAMAGKACYGSKSCPLKKAMSRSGGKRIQLNAHVPGQPYRYKHGWIKLPGTKDDLVSHLTEHHSGVPAGGRRIGPKNPTRAQLDEMHSQQHSVRGDLSHSHSQAGQERKVQGSVTVGKVANHLDSLIPGQSSHTGMAVRDANGFHVTVGGTRRHYTDSGRAAQAINTGRHNSGGSGAILKPTHKHESAIAPSDEFMSDRTDLENHLISTHGNTAVEHGSRMTLAQLRRTHDAHHGVAAPSKHPTLASHQVAQRGARRIAAEKTGIRQSQMATAEGRQAAGRVAPAMHAHNAAKEPVNSGAAHSELLKARSAARKAYPQGHPERLKAERAVRQSRKGRKSAEPSLNPSAASEPRTTERSSTKTNDSERHTKTIDAMKLGETKALGRGTVTRKSTGYHVTAGGRKMHYASAQDAGRAASTGKHGTNATAVKPNPGEVHAAAVLHNNGHVKDMQLTDLLAADVEFKRRADALGKPGQISRSHKAVRDEMAHRVTKSRQSRVAGAKNGDEIGKLASRDPRTVAENAITKSLSNLRDRSRYYGSVRVSPSAGSGFLVVINGEQHHYALASDAAKAIVAGRHTGVGTPPRNRSVRNAARRAKG